MICKLAPGDLPLFITVINNRFNNREDLEFYLKNANPPRFFDNYTKDALLPQQIQSIISAAETEGWLAQLFQIVRDSTKNTVILNDLDAIQTRAHAIPATSFNRTNNTGRDVVYLCDRSPQERRLWERLNPPPPTTHFLLLPGDRKASHDSFLKRFRSYTLPFLLKQPKESFQDRTEFITAEWVTNPAQGTELPFLIDKLAYKLDPTAGKTAEAFHNIPRFAGKIVLLQHVIYESSWTDQMLPLIRDYMNFWSLAGPAAPGRPWFLVFLFLVFDQSPGPPAIMTEIEAFEKSPHCEGCSVTLLPYLPLVSRDEVDAWMKEYLPDLGDSGDDLLDRLFPSDSVELAMRDLEKELRKLVQGMT